MDEFEAELYEDDDELNAPLDVRFVVLGLSMLILSLVLLAAAGNGWPKYLGALFFFASFFVMTKKQKNNPS